MKIRILGIDFDIKYNKERLNDHDAHGTFNYGCKEIALRQDSPVDIQKDTLMHETIEAINEMLELELPHAKITQLGTAFNQVTEDNPHLFDYKLRG